jgi:ornithine carbamoyltransferase
MKSALLQLPSRILGRPSASDVQVLLAHARQLQRSSDPKLRPLLLKGKNLGLLCESMEEADAALFLRAATELGARVSHIRPSLSDLSTPAVRRVTSEMLGRLYDGIECQGLPTPLVEQIGREAGIPVYDRLAGKDHPTAQLVALLDGEEPEAGKRQLVLQTVLLATLF